MVDALGCRQTEAEWSYRYLAQHSVTEELRTGRPITARIPERELLFGKSSVAPGIDHRLCVRLARRYVTEQLPQGVVSGRRIVQSGRC